jgi:hypothetical protein
MTNEEIPYPEHMKMADAIIALGQHMRHEPDAGRTHLSMVAALGVAVGEPRFASMTAEEIWNDAPVLEPVAVIADAVSRMERGLLFDGARFKLHHRTPPPHYVIAGMLLKRWRKTEDKRVQRAVEWMEADYRGHDRVRFTGGRRVRTPMTGLLRRRILDDLRDAAAATTGNDRIIATAIHRIIEPDGRSPILDAEQVLGKDARPMMLRAIKKATPWRVVRTLLNTAWELAPALADPADGATVH